MRVFLLGVVLLLGRCPGSRAQAYQAVNVKWFPETALVLTTGVMLRGTLLLYPDAEHVSITCPNDSTYTLPARLVRGFAVKDPLLDQLPSRDPFLRAERVFRVFPVASGRSSTPPAWGFYEQLSNGPGPVLLLRRARAQPEEVVIPRSADASVGPPNPNALTFAIYSGWVRTALYLRTAAGPVVPLRKPRHLLRYFAPHQASLLRAYARENGLRYASPRDLAFLVNYANTWTKPTP